MDDKHDRAVVGEVGHPNMGAERQATMRAGHQASSAVIGSLAGPALCFGSGGSGQQYRGRCDNTSQYLSSMQKMATLIETNGALVHGICDEKTAI
jgi:hypothetical protein